jgi:hypothetical protein
MYFLFLENALFPGVALELRFGEKLVCGALVRKGFVPFVAETFSVSFAKS